MQILIALSKKDQFHRLYGQNSLLTDKELALAAIKEKPKVFLILGNKIKISSMLP
jgi:hypothetical protein